MGYLRKLISACLKAPQSSVDGLQRKAKLADNCPNLLLCVRTVVNSAPIHLCSEASEGKIIHNHRQRLTILVFIDIIITDKTLILNPVSTRKLVFEPFSLVLIQLGKRENFHCSKLIRYFAMSYKNRSMGPCAQVVHKFIRGNQRVAGHEI
eukprot:XP_001704660.1 Hypothetical protein GL50803_20216 [Giardia lamblia ATCC 50803]